MPINVVGKLQIRKGSTSDRLSVILDNGEPGWDTDLNQLFVGDGQTNGGISINKIPADVVFIDSKSDFPEPVSGVITLQDNTNYIICNNIDLTGDRIVTGLNNSFFGFGSSNTSITSSGLDSGSVLLTCNNIFQAQNMVFSAQTGTLFEFNGSGNSNVDFTRVSVVNTPNIGTLSNLTTAVFRSCSFTNSSRLIFSGVHGSIVCETSLFDPRVASTMMIISPDATITRRVRLTNCAFIVNSGEIGIDYSTSAIAPDESYLLQYVDFSGGGTYLSGITSTSNKSVFDNCKGIINTNVIGMMYNQENNLSTTISTPGTYDKVNIATSLASSSQKFSHTNNRLTYIGASFILAKIDIVASLYTSVGANQTVRLMLYKNNSPIPESIGSVRTFDANQPVGIATQVVTLLNPNDYIELFVTNALDTHAITISSLNIIALKLPT